MTNRAPWSLCLLPLIQGELWGGRKCFCSIWLPGTRLCSTLHCVAADHWPHYLVWRPGNSVVCLDLICFALTVVWFFCFLRVWTHLTSLLNTDLFLETCLPPIILWPRYSGNDTIMLQSFVSRRIQKRIFCCVSPALTWHCVTWCWCSLWFWSHSLGPDLTWSRDHVSAHAQLASGTRALDHTWLTRHCGSRHG